MDETEMRRQCYEGAQAAARALKRPDVRDIASVFAAFVTVYSGDPPYTNRLTCLKKAVEQLYSDGSVSGVIQMAREMAEFSEKR